MRIAVTAGHNVYIGKYFDPGAVNPPLTEADIVKETVSLLIPILERQGHIVLDATPYGETFNDNKPSHVERCKRVDEFNADIYIDIHLNGGGGTGVEVWVHNMDSKSVPFAIKITENISKDMNLPNRGVKAKPTFWSVSLTSKPALIVEGAFIDSKIDMEKLTPLKYATAIAKAFGEIKVDIPIEEKLYRVQVGAYKNKGNAEKLIEELKLLGFNGIIVDGDVIKIDTPTNKSKYYKDGDTHIIETTPDNIDIKILGDTLSNAKSFGINGTFFDTPRPELPNSCWAIATNEGKPIGGNSMIIGYKRDIKRGTIIFYEDGSIEVIRVNSINEFKKPHCWSISGYSVYPYMNFKEEKMSNGIDYRTAHTYIGYKGNKIYLIVKPNHLIKDILPLIKDLGLEGCIVLDGGGSSQLRHPNGSYNSSRKINSAILLKQI